MKSVIFGIAGGEMPVIGWVNPSSYSFENRNADTAERVPREELKRRYLEYKECGFNTVFCMNDPIGANDDAVKEILEVCEEEGLGCLLIDAQTYMRELTEARLEEIKSIYGKFASFKGIMAFDEPNVTHFPSIAENYRRFAKVFPDKLFYVNLLPNYATDEQLAVSDYDEYISRFSETVGLDFLSYDNYPFVHFSKGILNNDKYFRNLSAVRKYSLKKDVPFMVFTEVTAFIKYAHIPNKNEIAWQVNTALCYGAKGIQYFTYGLPANTSETFSGGIIARDGSRTASYEAVKEINSALQSVGKYLFGAKSIGIIRIGDPPLNEFGEKVTVPEADIISPRNALKSVAGGNVLVGCFDSGGKEMYYLVNNDLNRGCVTTFKFNSRVRITVVRNAAEETPEPSDTFEFITQTGEGVLIILEKGE
ncbi:MAG: beta-galactosidase [Clostridia bacterium]|nr:beta-galactosidase [Clostridia bacterium]